MAAARAVVSMVVDLIGSTSAGLEMHDVEFRDFNRSLINYIWPLASEFGLEDCAIKFTGDGWLFFDRNTDRFHQIVALAKTIAETFQQKMARDIRGSSPRIPAIRIAICSGYDEEVNFGENQTEWVGDSARRATRAAGCCSPNEIVVSNVIRDAIFRIFKTTRITISDLPEDRKPRRWEEELEIYAVGKFIPGFLEVVKGRDNPGEYAPYITYLAYVDRIAAAEQLLMTAAETIGEHSAANAMRTGSPAALAGLAEISAQLNELLYAAPNREMRDMLLAQMTEYGLRPSLRVYNRLIRKTREYDDMIGWFDIMRSHGERGDSTTYTTLIRRAPSYIVAQRWYRAAREAGVILDGHAYNHLMHSAPDFSACARWLAEMRKMNVRVGVDGFNVIINRAPDYELAKRWLDKMQKAGVDPGVHSYNAVLAKAPNYRRARRFLDKMRDDGETITPGTIALVSKKIIRTKDAIELAAFVLSLGYIKFHPKTAELRELYYMTQTAEAWFADSLVGKGPKHAHINRAIKGFMAAGRKTEALRVASVYPFSLTARCLFRNHPDAAIQYFMDRVANGEEVHHAFYSLAYCYLELGRRNEAIAMFEKAVSLASPLRKKFILNELTKLANEGNTTHQSIGSGLREG